MRERPPGGDVPPRGQEQDPMPMVSSTALRGPARRFHVLPPAADSAVPPFVGQSPAVTRLLERADLLARTEVPLLLLGESGTGKEVLARRIHAQSRQAAGPFVAENCAAIPESLFESELFGHARGSFTGAERDRQGVFQRAHGGTLLLDEIGELPLALQAKLLRVLEDGRVRPVGAAAEQAVQVRVLSATNQSIEELVRAGRFREDLYYRLQGARLLIPPLRERPADVVELARHFLEQLNRDHGTQKTLVPQQLERLARCAWPGNARQLRNEVAQLYYLSDCDQLDAGEPDLAAAAPRRPRADLLVTAVAPLAEIERDALLLTLSETGGNREQAARRLGISRSSLYDRIRRHGIAV